MSKKNNKEIIILMGVIIIILAVLCVLFATDTLTITTKNENVTTSDKTDTKSENTDKTTTNDDVNSEDKTEDKSNDNNSTLKKFTFNTSYGTETIEAEEALTGRGSAGASSKIFYLKDHKLYLYGHGESDELLANGVDKIYYKTEQTDQISVVLNSTSTISKENSYIEYEK